VAPVRPVTAGPAPAGPVTGALSAEPAPSGPVATARPAAAPLSGPSLRAAGHVGLLANASRRANVVGVPDGVNLAAPADLRRACERLREDVAALALPLDVPGADTARLELAALVAQLDDYLLPRLRRIDAPLLAVVGGSTGAGKSTLVNSLVRRFVTRSGILRPTTRSPVLIHHPYDSGAFLTQRILPGFARVTSEAPEPLQPIEVNAPRVTALRLVPDEGLAPGLAIIDAPDIDSLVETNRDLALQLFAAADLWIFVTTAARYSDAVPWDTLKKAVDRGVSVAVVLDRVPAEAMAEVRVHLATMLRDRGLSTAPLFTIPETTKETDGFLPEEIVRPLHGWLSRLARDSRSRDVVVRRTLVGALDSLHERVRLIAAAAEAQAITVGELRSAISAVYGAAEAQLRAGLSDSRLLQGEVQARWQEYIGSGEAFRGFDGMIGRLRERVAAAVRRRSAPSAPLGEALRKAAVALAMTTAESALEALVRRWLADSAGQGLLREVTGGPALPASFPGRVDQVVRDWCAGVQDVIRHETPLGRPNPRAAAFGADGLGGLLMVLAFSDLNALTMPEASADNGTTVVAGQLLRAVLGGDVAALATSARGSLQARLCDLLATERARFEAAADAAGVRGDLAAALRGHLRVIEGAR
jgi:hypothetical protein